jgi:ATP-dependent protease HslVU (ClpYQ) peptidase subunit
MKDVLSAVKEVLLLTSRVDTLAHTVTALAKEVRDQDRRLIRLETMVEIAQRNRLAD